MRVRVRARLSNRSPPRKVAHPSGVTRGAAHAPDRNLPSMAAAVIASPSPTALAPTRDASGTCLGLELGVRLGVGVGVG
jgi:hypothetical protein